MDYKKLLEKYWVGDTSVEEEKELKAYFNGLNVAEELQQYRPLFQYFKQAQKQQLQKSILTVLESQNKKVVSIKKRNSSRNWLRMAAAILVLLIAGLGYQKINEPTKEQRLANYWKTKEIKDPQEAYRKTKAALFLVSNKLNKGTEAALNQIVKVQEVGQYIK